MATLADQLNDNTIEDPGTRAPLVLGGLDYQGITDTVADVAYGPAPPKAWFIVLGVSALLMGILFGCVGHLIMTGVGVWGNNNPVFWGWPIVNFVFWVGIGHAGTLISAILFLLRQNWRTSINRAAEAMTIFAVVCAGLFPGVHIGGVFGRFIGCFQFRLNILRCGRTSAVRCYGTFSLYRHTQPFHCCFGTWGWCQILQLSGIGRKTKYRGWPTVSWHWDGLDRHAIGIATKWRM